MAEGQSIYYDGNDNTFIDEWGKVIHDIDKLMSYDEVRYFKKVGGTYYTQTGCGASSIDYEIDFPKPDIGRSLYYDIEENVMRDEEGFIVFNIFSIISPNDLYLFKKSKEDMWVYGVHGGGVELSYPPFY